MAAEAPTVQQTPDAPKDEAPQRIELSSLAEIVAENQKGAAQAEPIDLFWFLPPTKDAPAGREMHLHVETRFPDDHWRFGVGYMTTVQTKMRLEEADAAGVMRRKHPLADMEFICKEIVVSPTWLHNESALTRFKEHTPPHVFSELRRKLMLVGRLDGDFFDDYQRLTIPMTYLRSASESPSGSGNTQTSSGKPPTSDSSPGSSTTASAASKTGDSSSPTTSGSSPSTPTTAPVGLRPRPTPTSETPSTSTPAV